MLLFGVLSLFQIDLKQSKNLLSSCLFAMVLNVIRKDFKHTKSSPDLLITIKLLSLI